MVEVIRNDRPQDILFKADNIQDAINKLKKFYIVGNYDKYINMLNGEISIIDDNEIKYIIKEW